MDSVELKKALHGISSIAITPMKDDGSIDYEGMKKHVRFLINNGINKERAVLVVGGSTGECGGMTVPERCMLIDAAIEEAGDELPIIAGCNHSSTPDVIELMKNAKESGACGVMVLAPYYYVPTDDAVLRFYETISDAVDIGIMLYNNLEVTHKDVPVEVYKRLVKSSNVVGIKECTPNFVKMERVVREVGADVSVVNGHGEFLEPFAALAGTVGFISSTSNFAPSIAVDMWNARKNHEYEKAKKIRDRLTPYLDLAVQESAKGGEPAVLAILKRATTLVGSCGGVGRIPLPEITDELDGKIRRMLSEIGLIK